MHIILLIAYGLLLSVAVVRIPFIKKSQIKPVYLLIFFWLRCITSFIHNIIAWRFYPNHGDIWNYFETGTQMKNALLHAPETFMPQFFGSYQASLSGAAFWSEISLRLIAAINMVLNFFSFDNFYINSLLFSFFIFIGSIALYRVFIKAFSGQLVCALTTLILPSALFFTACIHKDGLLYMLLGLFLWCWQKQLHSRFTVRGVITCALLFGGILLTRANMVFGLLPGVIMWTLTLETTNKTWKNVLIATSLVFLFIFTAGIAHPAYNFFTIISQRQHEFYYLQGKSRVFIPLLQPSAWSFLQALPFAVINGFFQPLPGQGGQVIYNAFSGELLLIWFFIIMAVYYTIRHKAFGTISGFGWFCLLLTATQLLLIGYIVPFIGAIIRYRSLFLPFLAAMALYQLRQTKIFEKADEWLKKTYKTSH
jgi:hypothetical protein